MPRHRAPEHERQGAHACQRVAYARVIQAAGERRATGASAPWHHGLIQTYMPFESAGFGSDFPNLASTVFPALPRNTVGARTELKLVGYKVVR